MTLAEIRNHLDRVGKSQDENDPDIWTALALIEELVEYLEEICKEWGRL